MMNEQVKNQNSKSIRKTPTWMRTGLWLIPIVTWSLLFAIFSMPEEQNDPMVKLVSARNPAQLQQIVNYLTSHECEFETPDSNTILVRQSARAGIIIQLAGQDIIGHDPGLGFDLLDETKVEMTDLMSDLQSRRMLQNELGRMIMMSSSDISVAKVLIQVPPPRMFKQDQIEPSASVKVVTIRELSPEQVTGIQNLVAMCVDRLVPERVVVVNGQNEILPLASNPVPISEKTYSEKSYTESTCVNGVYGPPGVDSNVQDTGIGVDTSSIGTDIEVSRIYKETEKQ